MNKQLEKSRTRWRRWLGNKTRCDKSNYLTLLESNWLGWVNEVLGDLYVPIGYGAARQDIKELYLMAINHANMTQLRRLDNIYAIELAEAGR